jgi:hypothetical protein
MGNVLPPTKRSFTPVGDRVLNIVKPRAVVYPEQNRP